MTIRNSFKQLFRRPGKTLLFFLLMLAATALLVFGAGLYYQNSRRMEALDNYYTTIATIRQPYETVENGAPQYGEIVRPEDLEFEGADYILPPESRPYMLSYMPGLNPLRVREASALFNLNVVEFEVLESGDGETPDKAVVTRDLAGGQSKELTSSADWFYWGYQAHLALGDEFFLDQSGEGLAAQPLEKGKRYVGSLYGVTSDLYHVDDGSQFGHWASEILYFTPREAPEALRQEGAGNLTEVTGDDFYQPGQPGSLWLTLVEETRMQDYIHPVLAASSGSLMPCVRQNSIKIRGRMITEEEFASGAKVCLVGKDMAQRNLLWEGKTVKLSLLASMYGYSQNSYRVMGWTGFQLPQGTSLLDSEGQILQPFWEEEYEVIGVFEPRYGTEELAYGDMFIIPAQSVQASDEEHVIYYGPMNRGNASFQIPNGAAGSFVEKMNAAIPEIAARVVLEFDDMGYSRAMDSLREAQQTAFLLFLVGFLAAAAIVALLMYFFIVLEKKRTAMERSLGLSNRQCRASLLAGVMTVTLCAALLGSTAAGVMLNQAEAAAAQVQQEEEEPATQSMDWGLGGIYDFSAKYSPWAMWDVAGNQADRLQAPVPWWVCLGAPLALTGLVGALALALVNRSLKTEPILLLNTHA